MKLMKTLFAAAAALFVSYTGVAATGYEKVGDFTWEWSDLTDYDGVAAVGVSPKPTGSITVPSTLNGRPVVELRWTFSSCDELTSVVIPDSVRKILKGFFGCDKLNSVKMPANLEIIGTDAFCACDSLVSIDIPSGVKVIGEYAFGDCDLLADIELPTGLETIENSAFAACESLSVLTIPSTVTNIGRAAFKETALISAVIPNGITNIASLAFSYCRNLTYVTIPEGVVSIGVGAFGNTALPSIALPSTLKEIGDTAFADNKSLVSVSIPSGVVRIGDAAFQNCSALTTCNVPAGVTVIKKGTFLNCTALTSMTLSEGLVRIEENAFRGCLALPTIDIPSSVNFIGPHCFEACRSLTQVVLPEGIIDIPEYAFCDCNALNSLNIPDSVRTIGKQAFEYTDLVNVVIPPTVWSIGDKVLRVRFHDVSVRFSGDQPHLVENSGGATLTGNVAYLPDRASWSEALASGTWCRYEARPLSEHPDSFTDFTSVGVFGGCRVTGVASTPADGAWLVVPSEIGGQKVISIAANAFQNLSGVEAIVLPDTIEEICENAFAGCTGLTTLAFPAALTALDPTALAGCSNLRAVVFAGKRINVADSLYADVSPSLKTYACWEKNYGSWSATVAGGTWCNRSVEWMNPIEDAWARGVAVYRSDLETLVFYGDGKDHASEGGVFLVANAEAVDPTSVNNVPWNTCASYARRIVFDASFANCRPKHCAKWFKGFANVESIEGLEYLDVSEATSLRRMFYGCSAVAELDLTGFATSEITDMTEIFNGCGSLETIYVSNGFDTSALDPQAQDLFTGCTSLAGGNGFTYDPSKVTAEYAKINDNETDGYFSRAPKAVAVLDSSDHKITFYYDAVDRSGIASPYLFEVSDAEKGGVMPWSEALILKVVFDESFAAYRPTCCANWFAGCTLLNTMQGMKNLDVSHATDLSGMFSNCTSLVELDLTHFETAGVTNIISMFSGCSKLKTIYASSRFTKDAMAECCGLEPVFDGCVSLVGGNGFAYREWYVNYPYAVIDSDTKRGYFSELKARAVAVYDSAAGTLTFYNDLLDHESEGTVYSLALYTAESTNPPWSDIRTSVTEVIFDESFATYRSITARSWFYNFSNLESIIGIEYLDVSAATTLRQMFASCGKLTELDLSRFDTRSATTMNNMFYKCSALVTIYVSTNFVTTALTNPEEIVFDTCTALVGGNGTAYATESSTNRRKATYARIDTLDTPGYFTERGLNAVAVVSTDGKTLTFHYDSADHSSEGTVYSVATAEAQLPSEVPPWSGAAGTVTNVVVARSFVNYAPKHCGRWFAGFSKLTGIDGLANLDLGKATSLQNMFYNCSKLTELDFSESSVGSHATELFAMFRGCSSLVSLDLSHFVTDAATDMRMMFGGCSSLTTLDLYSFQTANVTSMMNMFTDCSSLETILVSGGFTTDGITSMSEQVFYGCTSLKGGAGTVCDGYENISAAYAQVDGGELDPGYLTRKRVAVAVVSSDETTLTFYYDTADHTGAALVCLVDDTQKYPEDNPIWCDYRQTLTRVVIDPSFADYRPEHCNNWFQGLLYVQSFTGLRYINVSEATSLRFMFYGCDVVRTLDLTGWNTSSVRDMGYMFRGALLQEINVSSTFTNLNLDDGEQVVFLGCPSLRGENGTTWDLSLTSARFARIDAPGARGLLSRKLRTTVLCQGRTMTFYYDREEHPVLTGTAYSVEDAEALDPTVDMMPWWDERAQTDHIVIDPSFAAYRPRHCGRWFANFELADLQGLQYLDVSEATSLREMFSHMEGITTLDLSGFDTANVTDMENMIQSCGRLTTVYASDKFVTTALPGDQDMFASCPFLVGGAGTKATDVELPTTAYARIDDPLNDKPGFFTVKPTGGFVTWAAAQGLTGADAAWDAKPALWGGKWANAFIYTYGEGLADGTLTLMDISFGLDGKPVITTTPVVEGHDDFTPSVIGTTQVNDWTSPVELENADDTWTLKEGDAANFFRVRLSE